MATCQLARAQLAHAVAQLRQSSGLEQGLSVYKALKLASPALWARKFAGDAGNFFGRVFIDQPVGAAADLVQATARSAATHFTTPISAFRTSPGTLTDLAAWKAMLSGVGTDWDKAMTLIKTGVDPDLASRAWNLGQTNFANPIINRAVHASSDAIEGISKVPFGLAFRESLYRNAKLNAIQSGLTGQALTARVNQLMAIPTPEMMVNAMEAGNRAVFKNKTWLGETMSRAQQNLLTSESGSRRAAGTALSMLVPFPKVPSALAAQALERSPVGLASTLLDAAFGKNSPESEALAVRFGKGLTGTGVGAALAAAGMLYKAGKLTGDEPDGPKQRALWALTNRQPNSVLIDGKWHEIGALGPLAFPFLFMANAAQAAERTTGGARPGVMDYMRAIPGAALHAFTESTYLRELSALGELTGRTGGNAFARVGAGLVPIPGVATSIERATDPYQRDAHTLAQMLQSRIPGAAQSLPPRLDAFGRPIPSDQSVTGVIGLSRTSPVRHDPVVDALTQYNVPVGMPPHELTVGKRREPLDDDQYRQLLQLRGSNIQRVASGLVASPQFAALPTDAARSHALLHALQRADAITRLEFARTQARSQALSPAPLSVIR